MNFTSSRIPWAKTEVVNMFCCVLFFLFFMVTFLVNISNNIWARLYPRLGSLCIISIILKTLSRRKNSKWIKDRCHIFLKRYLCFWKCEMWNSCSKGWFFLSYHSTSGVRVETERDNISNLSYHLMRKIFMCAFVKVFNSTSRSPMHFTSGIRLYGSYTFHTVTVTVKVTPQF